MRFSTVKTPFFRSVALGSQCFGQGLPYNYCIPDIDYVFLGFAPTPRSPYLWRYLLWAWERWRA
jgi:hypothetical protein